MAWYDPITTIINLISKKPTPPQWYAAWQAIIDKIELMCLDLVEVSTTHRGLVPKLDGNATHFLRSDGTQAVPAGTGIGLGGASGAVDGAILLADGENTDTIKGSGITIETSLTDDDTKSPTSGAVYSAVAAVATETIPVTRGGTGLTTITAGDLLYGDGANSLGKLTKGDAGKVLTAGASTLSWETPTGGASFWTALSNFTATPASTSTITMGTDQTATILVGSPLKYTIGGTVYYGMVSAITSNLLTVAGAPLGGDVTALSLGDASRIEQVDIVVNGYYEDADNTALIGSDLNAALVWRKSKSYAVAYKVWSKVHDSHATHGKATVLINATELNTSADGLTIAADATWYSTVVDIATAAYDINPAEVIEIAVKKGGTGDAHDLVVSIMFVHP